MRKARHFFLILAFLLALFSNVSAQGASPPPNAAPGTRINLQTLLTMYMSLAEEYLAADFNGLKLLSLTREAKSGQWEAIKGLLSGFAASEKNAAAVWFALPDGSYYTTGEGLTGQNLKDRIYFPRLMAGTDVAAELVVSKSTGKRSAVTAVPIKQNGTVIGALGVSLDVEKMSRMLDEKMDLPGNILFYALDRTGKASLHRKSDFLFVFPSDLGSPTLNTAVQEMLDKQQGVVRYQFQGEKTVVFKKSELTGWTFALGIIRS